MPYLSGMPKDPDKKRYEVHFLPDKSKEIEKAAKDANRSVKNYLETIILDFIEGLKKKKK
jgi:hypothetical protein